MKGSQRAFERQNHLDKVPVEAEGVCLGGNFPPTQASCPTPGEILRVYPYQGMNRKQE